MKVYLDTIGCRLNQAEIELYARQLVSLGHELVAQPEEADLAVINTCMVTTAAESDSRQKIRQVHRAGVDEMVITGCWVTLKPEDALALPGIRQVIPNSLKDHLVREALNIQPDIFDLEPVERQPVLGARFRTRAFIKAQDGCDNHCTFCITTLARGEGKSRTIKQVLDDIHLAVGERLFSERLLTERLLSERGLSESHYSKEKMSQRGDIGRETGTGNRGFAKEIVLTGVHLGSWGQDLSPRLHIGDLVRAILENSDVPRVRLSSLEPWDLDVSFFSLWQDERLCRHLHLPLQSGCATTLRRMARKTTPQAFARLVEAARKAIPGVAVTTDIITGFPGESDDEFAESLAFVEATRFAGGHVFVYSPRPGTAALNLPGKVAHQVSKRRSAVMRAALAHSGLLYREQFLNKVLPVLWESATQVESETQCANNISDASGGWQLTGLTDNYLRVQAIAPQPAWNTISPVRLVEVQEDGMLGACLCGGEELS
jgi:threonylcarbamoyladenosine tRNA methylthiotransferase MtaB